MLPNDTFDLLASLEQAKTTNELWTVAEGFLERIGVTHSIYTFVRPGATTELRAWTSLPQEWCQHYLDEEYVQVDPFYRHCCKSFEPVGTGPDYLDDHWFLTQPERRVILEGGETGFRSGFSSPVRLLGETGFGGWNFGSSLRRSEFETLFKQHGQELRLCGFYIHEHAERLAGDAERTVRYPKLTKRERECLLWLGLGYRTAGIADRLGIAIVTVDMHLRNARTKLNAATREEALAKAIAAKLIMP